MGTIKDYSVFLDYLRSLSQDGNPFNCPLLRVLPEDVLYAGEGRFELKKGDFICQGKPGSLGPVAKDVYCGLGGDARVIQTTEGQLEVEARCSWNGSTFRLKVTDFVAKER